MTGTNSQIASLKTVAKGVGYLTAVGILSVFISKAIINRRRDEQFKPAVRSKGKLDNKKDTEDTDEDINEKYYANLANVKPGFPLPNQQSQQREQNESVNLPLQNKKENQRKSEFEGAGLSYLTRKRGDKLGFFSRWNVNSENDGDR
ncbi:uncharacterized protein SCODWIG_01727 [Saccharomycodes ludwigii]|uniref:Uncharacterized protein n=1 Tax=Saccharomycodes ludwigii TaxID=36035 RepID=A0A376B5I9_9ASCO|nr:hypothetical protein SCDLUD_003237 [Saccharomycodes ludwigii]KAH3900265.1 hypothetical protein SCDLUD_003237 [Saccharomycodes ludwigii]SSD59966.1 uncharacterized protein SCODWIG_01727 [Saccharomycodes ludwigii]